MLLFTFYQLFTLCTLLVHIYSFCLYQINPVHYYLLWAFRLVLRCRGQVIIYPVSGKSRRITPFPIPNDSAHCYTQWGLHLLRFFNGVFVSTPHGVLSWLQLVMVALLFISPEMKWFRKLSPSILYCFNSYWQTCMWCSFHPCVNIHWIHLAQTL